MLTYSQLFETKLREMIEAEIAVTSTNLGGGCAQDFAAYQRLVGRVLGLNAALDMCENVRSDLAKT